MKFFFAFLLLVFSSLSLFAQSKPATWIWYPGDYEIWLSNKMQAERTERGAFFPPLWRYYNPYSLVTFRKKVSLENEDSLTLKYEGQAKIQIDGAMHYGDPHKLLVPKGNHTITIKVYNQEKVPALFVKGSVVKSDDSWEITFEDKEWIDETGRTSGESGTNWEKVGSWNFDSADNLPSAFKLAVTPQTAVKTEKYKDGILVDFGKETFGFARLQGLKGKGNVTLYYGESAEEAKSVEHCETLDKLEFDGTQTAEFTLKQSKAFRYIYVVLSGGIKLDSVSMLYEYLPLEYKGAFKSSDAELNKIWDVSVYTLQLTTREFFIDGIKRDRWVWSGDAYQSYLMNYYLFFDNPSVKRTLYALRGKEPVNSHINTIMDYSFYWFLGVYDYYKFSGDKEFVKQIYPRMKSLMQFCLDRRNANGMMEGLPGDWVFIDWADGLTKQGEVSFEQLLFAKSLEIMALSAEVAGDKENAAKYKTISEDLKKKLFEYFWSKEKQAFIHNRVNNQPTDNVTRYTNMFAIFFDYLSDEEKQQVKKSVLLNDKIQKITTPYMRFYELEALCAMGEQKFVTQEIKDYWGGMLKLGATSFWEKYDPKENGEQHLAMYGRPFGKSLSHAWGASPVYLFGRYYFGVEPTSPGYKTFQIKPNLGGLDWIEGKVPTPNGSFQLYISKTEMRVKADEGEGKLVFQSQTKPTATNGKVTELGGNKYQITIQPKTEYRVQYQGF